MPLFTYSRDIPNGPNNPSVDQPKMKINNNSIDDLIEVDHVSFNDNNGGYHTIIHQEPTADPAPIASVGQTYVKDVTSGALPTDTQLFFETGLGDIYQLTGPFPASAALTGYTSLPGGIVLQWGVSTKLTDQAITFPIAFPNNVFSIVLTGYYNTNSRGFWWVKTRSLTQFTAALRDSSGSDILTTFSWIAIGN